MPGLDEPVHRRAVRVLDAEDLGAGVGVRVEVDEPDGAVRRRARADVRLRDRVVAAEHDRHGAGRDRLADGALDRRVRPHRIGRDDRRVAEVDDAEDLRRVDAGLEVRAGRAARGADRARREARARPVRDEVVGRRADDRDVDALELRRVLRVRQAAEREQPRVVRLVAEVAPALERVDHVGLDAQPLARGAADRALDVRVRAHELVEHARTERAAAARRTPRSPSRAADSRTRFPSRAPRARRRTRPGRARGCARPRRSRRRFRRARRRSPSTRPTARRSCRRRRPRAAPRRPRAAPARRAAASGRSADARGRRHRTPRPRASCAPTSGWRSYTSAVGAASTSVRSRNAITRSTCSHSVACPRMHMRSTYLPPTRVDEMRPMPLRSSSATSAALRRSSSSSSQSKRRRKHTTERTAAPRARASATRRCACAPRPRGRGSGRSSRRTRRGRTRRATATP